MAALTKKRLKNGQMEVARTQAAWGEVSLRSARRFPSGRALLAQAHHTFVAHQAQAELKAVKPLLGR